MSRPRIACLAWGSLLWDPRTLPMLGEFRDDGPMLPIEFSRVALDGRVTLVLDPEARAIRTYWVRLAVDSLEEAVSALGLREKIPEPERSRWIGVEATGAASLSVGDTHSDVRATIAHWLSGRELDAVVWTALPSRGADGALLRPDLDRLLSHLISLEGEARARAREYIQRAPRSVRTRYRAKFEAILGWHPTAGGD